MLLALNLLVGIIWDLEGPAAARRQYEEAAALAQRHDLVYERALMLTDVGLTAAMQHDPTGVQALAEAITSLHRLGNLRLVAFCLEGLGAFAGLARHNDDGVRVLGAAARLRERITSPTTPVNYSFLELLTAAARGPLDNDGFTGAWRAGQALTLEEAIRLALGCA